MTAIPFLEAYRKTLPVSVLETVRGAGSSTAAKLPGPSYYRPTSVVLPFSPEAVPGPRLGARASRPEAAIAFMPASVAKADLPNIAGIAYPSGLSVAALPEILVRRVAAQASAGGVRASREERRLEQRRKARADAEAEAQAAAAERLVAVDALLRRGGLWRVEDLAAETGCTEALARQAIDALARDGGAVLVALGHWRSRLRPARLCEEGRSLAARTLGFLLHGLSLDARTVALHAGVPVAEARTGLAELAAAGLAAPAPCGAYVCPEATRLGLVSRLGPAELSGLCERVLDDLHGAGPSRKIEVANRLGIGRGSINRTVDRLVEDGWVSRTGPDLFAVAA